MGKLIKALAEKQALEAPATAGGVVDPKNLEFYQALYDFVPQDPMVEMGLKKGDIVAVLQKLEGGWWRGRKRDGSMGFVPGNYLDIIPRKEDMMVGQHDRGKGVEMGKDV